MAGRIDKMSTCMVPEESLGKGLPRKSFNVLLLGSTGSGKTTLINQFLISAKAANGKKCEYASCATVMDYTINN